MYLLFRACITFSMWIGRIYSTSLLSTVFCVMKIIFSCHIFIYRRWKFIDIVSSFAHVPYVGIVTSWCIHDSLLTASATGRVRN